MGLVAGVDSSTQSTKVELRDVDTGTLVATGRAPHPPTSPPTSEQHPDAWWTALREACAQLGAHRRDVVALAVAGQQHGLVVLGADDEVLRPAKLWNDTTSAPQAAALVAALGARRWATACGSVPVASFTVTKLRWLRDHEPRTYAAARRVLLPHDWLTWRLTGEPVTDRGDASGTGWWSPRTGRYDPELLAAVDAERDLFGLLPRVLAPGDVAGTLSADAADELGLPVGIPVGPGTGDNMAAALGLGLRPGDVAISLGTSGTAFAASELPTADATGAVAGFADATGRFLPLVCTLNATRVTDTVAAWLGVDTATVADLALAGLDRDAGRAGRPVFVPYFDGERTPDRPDATGLVTGLRTSTTREQLALAAHLGVVCGLLDGRDALTAAGVALEGRQFLIGGGARSPAYRRVVADLTGLPVLVPDADETVATGACVQAAAVLTGAGFDEVADAWDLGAGLVVEPQPGIDAVAERAAYQDAAKRV